MPGVFEALQRKLYNLAGNNRSLFVARLSKETDVDLKDFDFQLGQPCFQIIKDLLAAKPQIPLCAVGDPRDPQVSALGKTLKKVDRKSKFLAEERGTQDLYVGYPMVEGMLQEDVPIRTPLIFFPVKLEQKGDKWMLLAAKDQPPFINKFFLLAYSHYLNLPLPEAVWNEDFQDFDSDATAFRTQLFRFFEDFQLAIHFNQDLFIDDLKPILPIPKSEHLASNQPGKLKLQSQAMLGIFALSDLFLINDYDQLADKYEKVEDVFPSIKLRQEPLKEEHILTCLPTDAPQEMCLEKALKGESFVVQGPPGTGKSQLIANLTANFMAEGKKVLVVCQKRAALDVVFDRLKDIGISNFVSLVHDYRLQLRDIYNQLASQIEKLPDFQADISSLNSVIIEREFVQHARKIDALSQAAEVYRHQLLSTSRFGVSLAELYQLAVPAQNLPGKHACAFQVLDLEDLNLKFSTFHRLWQAAGRLENEQIKRRLNSATLQVETLPDLFEKLQEVRLFLTQDLQVPVASLETMLVSETQLDKILNGCFALFPTTYSKAVTSQPLHQILAVWKPFMQLFEKWKQLEPLNWTVFYQLEIEHWQMVCAAAGKKLEVRGVQSWFFPFSTQGKLLKKALLGFGLKSHQVSEFDSRLNQNLLLHQLKKQFEALAKAKIDPHAFVAMLPVFGNQGAKWLVDLEQLSTTGLGWQVLEQLWKLKVEQPVLYQTASKAAQNLQQFFEPNSLEKVWQNQNSWSDLSNFSTRFYKQIQAFDALTGSLNPQQNALFAESVKLLSAEESENLSASFLNLIYNAWISELEEQADFKAFDDIQNLNQLSNKLQDGIQNKVALSQNLLHLKLFQIPVKDLAFNRLNNRTTYRNLEHEVTKKRRVWPLRKLMAQFSEEVFQLLPCWLTSPEAASAIFPLERLFDVVIFDEASQCYAEKAIPVFDRAKQVIVIGDSKQLPPNTLYRVVWDENSEDEYSPENEVDAALDLARFHLPELALTWHYRCLHPDLMRFSNQHFYQNKLTVIPQKSFTDLQAPVFQYFQVNGLWKNQTNLQEVKHLTMEARYWLQHREGQKTVGVVTFNQPQQELMTDALWNLFGELGIGWPEWLWVKNIENVQGDEADWIYFSLGYGPDEQGKIKANFGTLNQAGGEKRLNVAVTRAREKIVVVASLKPHQLEVENAANPGPKLLKKFLEFVLEKSKQDPGELKELKGFFSSNLQDVAVSEAQLTGKAAFGHYPLLLKRRGWPVNWTFSRNTFLEKQSKA